MLVAGEGRLGQLPGGLIALCMCLWWQAGGLGGGVRPGYKASFYGRVRSATILTEPVMVQNLQPVGQGIFLGYNRFLQQFYNRLYKASF